MKKSWGLIPEILDGRKSIESRWYKTKRAPWNKIKPGDVVYFKNSGESVTVEAAVAKVLQLENLNPSEAKNILQKFGKEDGIEKEKIKYYFELFKDKKYCLLIFIKNIKQIKPFQINKTGFGAMAAWLCVESINKIKLQYPHGAYQQIPRLHSKLFYSQKK